MAIDPAILRNELDALTHELSQLLRTAGARHGASSAPPIAATLEALGTGLIDADFEVERLIRARPLMATASAFALGIAIGLLLRRT